MSNRHYAATTDEEEELALALALSASIAEQSGRPAGATAAPVPSTSAPQSAPRTNSGSGRRLWGQPAAAPPPAHLQPPAGSIYPAVPSAGPAIAGSQYPPAQYPGAHGGCAAYAPAPSAHTQAAHKRAPTQPAVQPAHPPPALLPHHPQPSAVPARVAMPPRSSSSPAFPPASSAAPTAPAQPAKPRASSSTGAAAAAAIPARKLFTDPAKCAGCGQSVMGTHLSAMGRLWHTGCFSCGFCAEPVNAGGATQFAIGTDGFPYHMDCFKHRFHPVCRVCGEFITSRNDGRIEYKEQPFWRHTYCTHHVGDGTPQCCSCSRYQPKGQEYAQLDDGRHLCLECIGTVVCDTADAQPLYAQVMDFYKRMGMPHPEKPPLMLVDGNTLNEYSDREGKDTRAGGPVFHVRGLTMATVYSSIPSMTRTLGAGGLGVSAVLQPLGGGGARVKCDVTGILVLYGLPRLLTGCIIAHELMHAWLRMKHVAGLPTKVEEGLCQLMAYVWLDQQAGGLREEADQKLASYFSYQIREDVSEVYGDGFRAAYDSFQTRGLSAVVNDVLRRGRIA